RVVLGNTPNDFVKLEAHAVLRLADESEDHSQRPSTALGDANRPAATAHHEVRQLVSLRQGARRLSGVS
ncbi:hypothetical protein LF833_32585, partial [Pseudomonas aeruginosa]|nr:hypothetical protein [Pseudomonas aeruginosa]